MVKVVFLDVDDTLLDFDLCAASAMRRGFAQFGFPFDDSTVATFTGINEPLWKKVERGELTREELLATRWDIVFRALGIDCTSAIFEPVFHDLLKTAAVPVDGAAALAAYLHGKYTVCIASNASYAQQFSRLTLAGIAPHVDHYFVSKSIGFHKPEPGFFDACFASLPGIRPEECVMIGDSLTADVAGGANAGMQTIWFNKKKEPVPADCKADRIVTSLDEIRQIL